MLFWCLCSILIEGADPLPPQKKNLVAFSFLTKELGDRKQYVSLQFFFQAPATHFVPFVFNLPLVEDLVTALEIE